MRTTSIVQWLLVALLLAGCSSAAEPSAVRTNTETATAAVVAITSTEPAQPTDTPAAPSLPNGGGLADDASPLPATAVAAASSATPLPTASAIPTPTAGAPTATALPATVTPAAVTWSTDLHPLQIEVMRQQSYPGSPITIEQTLEPGSNYQRYVVSYLSDGFKVYALMTVPTGTKPATGWPAIVFNHGYIPPSQYRTTERYVAYVDAIARNGYIVFKSDFRGFGASEGGDVAGGGYGTPAYTVDVLNALASLKSYADVDPDRIGMWGHSLGGQLTLRAMVVAEDIKAGVIWGGVVPPYPEIIALWDFARRPAPAPDFSERAGAIPETARRWIQSFSAWVQEFTAMYGTWDENPAFWATISPNSYLADLSGPIELHHSTTDTVVPVVWAEILAQELEAVDGQPHTLYTYPGDDHNISANFGLAMQRTVAFFDQYVKGE